MKALRFALGSTDTAATFFAGYAWTTEQYVLMVVLVIVSVFARGFMLALHEREAIERVLLDVRSAARR